MQVSILRGRALHVGFECGAAFLVAKRDVVDEVMAPVRAGVEDERGRSPSFREVGVIGVNEGIQLKAGKV